MNKSESRLSAEVQDNERQKDLEVGGEV